MTTHFQMAFHSPLGWIRAVSDGSALIRLDWDQSRRGEPNRSDDVSRETISQLKDYFSGKRLSFDLPINLEGKSETARHWLNVMMQLPYGSTVTYKEFAVLAGKPRASRAAGTACALNPISIIFPCHRVIKSDGTIGNYGGGSSLPSDNKNNLARKLALISLERTFFNCSFGQRSRHCS